ncbi:hypothetical protein DNHGIG_00810 [Collibacillus ludicampi]|uniref:Uncharacterized protein n=1 Tax=Collibacillus ludicampi TaxID=2771369 RepID=A0AAV4LAM1_9BACL|nr:hypothetical protein [Collibacillus ludicampi]GIM44532.1 hypothetical protein DNHGIG_00810 [Collibacillus ludicampi]
MVTSITLVGGAIFGVTIYGLVRTSIRYRLRQALFQSGVYHDHRKRTGKNEIKECSIKSILKTPDGYDVTLLFPVGLSVKKLIDKLDVIEMAVNGRIDKNKITVDGRYVRILIEY